MLLTIFMLIIHKLCEFDMEIVQKKIINTKTPTTRIQRNDRFIPLFTHETTYANCFSHSHFGSFPKYLFLLINVLQQRRANYRLNIKTLENCLITRVLWNLEPERYTMKLYYLNWNKNLLSVQCITNFINNSESEKVFWIMKSGSFNSMFMSWQALTSVEPNLSFDVTRIPV